MTTIYFSATGITNKIKTCLAKETGTGGVLIDRTPAMFKLEIENNGLYVHKHEYTDTAFTVDDALTTIHEETFPTTFSTDVIDEIFAFDKDGNLFAYHVKGVTKYRINATNYGATFDVEFDPFISYMGKFSVCGELSQGHRDNATTWETCFGEEETERNKIVRISFENGTPDGILVLSRSNKFIFEAISPEVTPDPPLIGASGVCWYYVSIASGAWDYFYNDLYYEDAQHNKIYPLSDGSVVAIFPVYSGAFDMSTWSTVIHYPAHFGTAPFYNIRATTKEPKYTVQQTNAQFNAHLAFYFGAWNNANNKHYLLEKPRLVVLGTELLLNIKELSNPITTAINVTAQLTYQGGLSMYAKIEYLHSGVVSYTDKYTRQIPLSMNILTDAYSEKMLDQRASYYTGLWTQGVGSVLGGVGGVIGGVASGNYFGAVQSAVSGATGVAGIINKTRELLNSTDAVNAQGSALSDFLENGDYLIFEPVFNDDNLKARWNLYGYNHLNPIIDSDIETLQNRPYYNYFRFSDCEIHSTVTIPEGHKETLRQLFIGGVWVVNGRDADAPFNNNNIYAHKTQNGGG